MANCYDVVIIGAGPAGSVLAARLARAGARVLLAEATRFETPRFGEFISPATRVRIGALGLLEEGWEMAHRPAHEFVSRWGSDHYVERNYIFDAFGAALTLNRVAFDRDLALSAARASAELWQSAAVRRVRREGGGWRVAIEREGSPVEVHAHFIAVCGGRRGGIIRDLPVQRARKDQLFCFGCWLPKGALPADVRPSVESYERGWVYSAPIPGDSNVVGVFTDRDLAAGRTALRHWQRMAEEVLDCHVARSRLQTRAAVHFAAPAGSWVTRPATGEGWCLLGDCAQAYDPLSSRGIREAVEGAELVAAALLRSGQPCSADFREYMASLERSQADYDEERTKFYGLERRWRNAPFWRRRTTGQA